MSEISARSHRFRVLDGWRGICALLVALFHFQANGFIAALPLVRHAWLFVDFFFVLSGFVITHACAQTLTSSSQVKWFALRRFARLWPLHAAVLAAFVALELYRLAATGSGFTGERSVFAIVTNLALIQSLGIHDTLTWNTPAWSISTEFYTYLVFASVCVLAASARTRIALSIVLIVGSIAVLAIFSRYGMRETFGWGFFRCLYGFFLGSLTYEIWKRHGLTRHGGSIMEIGAVVIVLAYLVYVPGNRALEYLAPLVFALLVWVFAQEAGIVSRVLARPAIGALGRWSYSIYMVHMLVIALLFSALDSFGPHCTRLLPDGSEAIVLDNSVAADAVTFAYLATVVSLASATWRFIERPGQRLFKNAGGGFRDARIATDHIPL